MKLSQILTIAVVAGALILLSAVILGQFLQNSPNYGPELRYSLTRIQLRYDYSCDENVYGVYLMLNNSGSKTVEGLSFKITNPLCAGAVPPTPSLFFPGDSLKVYLYSTASNGTITISGNDTQQVIPF